MGELWRAETPRLTAAPNPLRQRGGRDADMTCCLVMRHDHAIDKIALIAPRVAGLIGAGDPPAIVRLIVAITINAVKGQIVGITMGQCLCREELKAIPLRTNTDVTTSIPPVNRVRWIVDTLPHTLPDCIQPLVLLPYCHLYHSQSKYLDIHPDK